MGCMIMASTKSFINLVTPISAPKATPSPKIRLPTFPKPLQLPFSLDEKGSAIREKLSSVRDTAADEKQSRILLKISETFPDFRILEVPSFGCLKFLLMCGILTLQTTERALAGSDISTSLQPFSFLGDLGDISTVSEKCKRRMVVVGIGALTAVNISSASPLLAQGKPEDYQIFVDKTDGYSYSYPSDWREFDFLGHDSAFKDRYLQLQNVRLSFIPTNKTDIHELGTSMEEVVENLTSNVYSAPNQFATILGMQEKNIDGRSYCTFEYILTSPNFKRAAFATIAIGNGRYYTLIVGANERRWRRVRNQLKVVADSFKVLDI